MSYKKNRYPQNPKKPDQQERFTEDITYANSGEDKIIYTGSLTSSQPYQRPIEKNVVEHLVKEWDERLFDPIAVSFRDGKFHVVDGQHRIIALRQMNDGKHVMVACKVYSGMTYQQEADFCYKLDKAKKRLNLSQSTNAIAESGVDAEISAIKAIVESCGFIWALREKGGNVGEITATRATINTYRLLGSAAFTRMMRLLRDTWHGSACSLTARVLSGLALFIKTYETEMNDKVFISQLSRVDPEEIIRRGKLDFSTAKYALRFARVILEKYNVGKGSNKLPYRFNG